MTNTEISWKYRDYELKFSDPQITPFHDTLPISTMDEVLYFYYQVDFTKGDRSLLSARTHDWPKVKHLPGAIDRLINSDLSNAQLLSDFDEDGTGQQVKYLRINLEDGFDQEYFFVLERTQYHNIPYEEPKDEEDDVEAIHNYYTLSIGDMMTEYDENLGYHVPSHVETFTLKHLEKEDLLALKETAERFCHFAVEDYMRVDYPQNLAYALEHGEE